MCFPIKPPNKYCLITGGSNFLSLLYQSGQAVENIHGPRCHAQDHNPSKIPDVSLERQWKRICFVYMVKMMWHDVTCKFIYKQFWAIFLWRVSLHAVTMSSSKPMFSSHVLAGQPRICSLLTSWVLVPTCQVRRVSRFMLSAIQANSCKPGFF